MIEKPLKPEEDFTPLTEWELSMSLKDKTVLPILEDGIEQANKYIKEYEEDQKNKPEHYDFYEERKEEMKKELRRITYQRDQVLQAKQKQENEKKNKQTPKTPPPEKEEEPPDYYFTIKKDFHTKKQIDIWKVKIKRNYRITREHFTELKEVIKDFDGYYSHYSKAFIFETEPTSEKLEDFDKTIHFMMEQEKTIEEQGKEYNLNYRPLSEHTNQLYNLAKWSEEDINDRYENNIREWEETLKRKLNIETLNKLPPQLREAFNRYQKVLIEFFQKKASANSIYPNPAVTGTSGYKNMDYKREKANRIERNAWEKYEYAKKKLNKTINLYLSRKIQNTPKTIDFTAENLNQEIAKIRKEFKPELKTIKKAFGGTTKGRKRSNYFLEFEKGMFRLEINEFGNYVFHPYDDYRNLKNISFTSVREMMEQLKIDIKTIIENLRKS